MPHKNKIFPCGIFVYFPFSLARAAFRSRPKRQAQIKLRHELYKFIVRAAFFTPPFARIPHDAFRTPLSSRRFPHAVRATSENLNDGILSMSLFARLRRFSHSEFLAPLSSRYFSCAVCDYRKRRTSFAMSLYYNCFYCPVTAKLLPRTITPH